MRVRRKGTAWVHLGIVLAALGFGLAACGGDTEILAFPGPTPTASVVPEPTQDAE